ncbi:MAG: carboxypeptidase regulatory-like domain-containing protein [Candidatus Aminicenantales bacterium]
MKILRGRILWRLSIIFASALLTFSSVIGATDINEINKLAKECKSGKTGSCQKLAKIAKTYKVAKTHEGDLKIRIAAIEQLTDQAVLTEIATNKVTDGRALISQEDEVRLAAIRNSFLSDEKVLFDIAWNDNSYDVHRAAAERITDPDMLVFMARNHEDSYVSTTAITKITDQTVLADLAKNHKNFFVYRAAAGKITDPNVLADIAKNAKEFIIREEAVDNPILTDQSVLIDIARNDEVDRVCLHAALKITDPAVFIDFAKNHKHSMVRQMAVLRVNDPVLLAHIARNDQDVSVCEAAAAKIVDQAVLADIIKNHKEPRVRWVAVGELTDQAALADLAKNHEKVSFRLAAVQNKNLIDQKILETIVKNNPFDEVRKAAAEKLPIGHVMRRIVLASQDDVKNCTDSRQLADIAKSATDRNARWDAIKKIDDQALLADIAASVVVEAIQMAALEKLQNQEIIVSISKNQKQPPAVRWSALKILRDSGRFKIPNQQILDMSLEIRQSAIKQKNSDLYKKILKESTPETLLEMRKRSPKLEIQGRLVRRESGEPLANATVFLGEVKGGQEFTFYNDLMTTTDGKGNFTLKSVPNGFYTIAYSRSAKPTVPRTAIFTVKSADFNIAIQRGNFWSNSLRDGTLTIGSTHLDIELSFEVRESDIVEFDVFGTGIKKLEFEIY